MAKARAIKLKKCVERDEDLEAKRKPYGYRVWDRMKDEPAKSWHGFVKYRDMSEEGRSIAAVAALNKTNIAVYLKLATEWRWADRLRAWDAELHRVMLVRAKEARKKAEKNQIALAHRMQKLGASELEKVAEMAAKNPAAPIMKPTEILSFIQQGVDMERQALGQPDEVIQVKEEREQVDFEKFDL